MEEQIPKVRLILKSVSHLPHDRFVQGTLLNMKIEPEMLNSENGIMQMMALLRVCAALEFSMYGLM